MQLVLVDTKLLIFRTLYADTIHYYAELLILYRYTSFGTITDTYVSICGSGYNYNIAEILLCLRSHQQWQLLRVLAPFFFVLYDCYLFDTNKFF